MNQSTLNRLISINRQVCSIIDKSKTNIDIDCKEQVTILFDVIREFIEHTIQLKRKKIDFITENYNLIRHKSKRDEMSIYVTEIQELNQLLTEISKVFNRVIELSK